jgi:uncharacterized protein YfcZ (UPF0381/DUF406 family)
MKIKQKKAIDFIGPSVSDLGLTLKPQTLATEVAAVTAGQKEQSEKLPEIAKSAALPPKESTDLSENSPKGSKRRKEVADSTVCKRQAVETVIEARENTNQVKKSNAINANAEKEASITTKKESFHRRAIRNYLNNVLGDKDSAEFKISKMQQDLDITLKTVYKHLRYLRTTEFEIKQLRYTSLLRRRAKVEE